MEQSLLTPKRSEGFDLATPTSVPERRRQRLVQREKHSGSILTCDLLAFSNNGPHEELALDVTHAPCPSVAREGPILRECYIYISVLIPSQLTEVRRRSATAPRCLPDSSILSDLPKMQPSDMEIAREMENIRSMRRISSQSGPGSLALDPDLPSASPSLPPQRRSALPGAALGTASDEDEFSEDSLPADDPSHLFWVPAHLHPELAPGEFRAFLQEHTRTVEEGTTSETPGTILRRAGSGREDHGLGRRASMLSRQYKPREGDGVGEEEEKIVPVKRNRSIFNRAGPQLTISDLQRLESLADEASKSNDPTQLRSVIRRSMSLNLPLSCE
jgi:hypothetical protein